MNGRILSLFAHTDIHAGTGQNLGTIDLPIMREAHTEWPVIFGSAVKGALRAHATLCGTPENEVKQLFGDDAEGGSEFAGALAITDARLLALPVRSLNQHFLWVTCPAILKRFADDVRFAGLKSALKLPELRVENGAALACTAVKKIYLEDLALNGREDGSLKALCDQIAGVYAGSVTAAELHKQLVIVSDDIFHYLAKFSTPVNAHIAIDSKTKIVKRGALWYEESLPSQTLLYSVVLASPSRQKGGPGAADLLKIFWEKLFAERPYLQLGGNETTGMGWCRVALAD